MLIQVDLLVLGDPDKIKKSDKGCLYLSFTLTNDWLVKHETIVNRQERTPSNDKL